MNSQDLYRLIQNSPKMKAAYNRTVSDLAANHTELDGVDMAGDADFSVSYLEEAATEILANADLIDALSDLLKDDAIEMFKENEKNDDSYELQRNYERALGF